MMYTERSNTFLLNLKKIPPHEKGPLALNQIPNPFSIFDISNLLSLFSVLRNSKKHLSGSKWTSAIAFYNTNRIFHYSTHPATSLSFLVENIS